jgi:hypothetical protein
MRLRWPAVVLFVAYLSGCGRLLGVDFGGHSLIDDDAGATVDDTTTPPDEPAAEARDAAAEASTPDAKTTPIKRCDPAGNGRLLDCSSMCPSSLFASVVVSYGGGSAGDYATTWTPTYVEPTPTADGLSFGPHPVSSDWWENYSVTTTKETHLGDVLACVRVLLPVGASGTNSFELTLRGGSEGMVFGVNGLKREVSLSTKASASGTWVEHASAPITLPTGQHEIELALYGHGNDFAAEWKDVDTGAVGALRATYAVPPEGSAALVGWELPQAALVRRVAIGIPTMAAADRISRP